MHYIYIAHKIPINHHALHPILHFIITLKWSKTIILSSCQNFLFNSYFRLYYSYYYLYFFLCSSSLVRFLCFLFIFFIFFFSCCFHFSSLSLRIAIHLSLVKSVVKQFSLAQHIDTLHAPHQILL